MEKEGEEEGTGEREWEKEERVTERRKIGQGGAALRDRTEEEGFSGREGNVRG